MDLEERVRKLEAATAYQDRRTRRITEVLKSAAGQLMKIHPASTLLDVIAAIRAAAGQLASLKE